MARNAETYSGIMRDLCVNKHNSIIDAANLAITLAAAALEPPNLNPALQPRLVASGAGSRALASTGWTLSPMTAQEAYNRFTDMALPDDSDAQDEAFETAQRGLLGHVLVQGGQVLSSCSQYPTTISGTPSMAHLHHRCVEDFLAWVHSTHVRCGPKDRQEFHEMTRKSGESALEFGAKWMEKLEFLMNSTNGTFAPPVPDRLSMLFNAMGGDAGRIREHIMAGLIPEQSLDQVIKLVYDLDMRNQANPVNPLSYSSSNPSHNARGPAQWDVSAMSNMTRNNLITQLNAYAGQSGRRDVSRTVAAHHPTASAQPFAPAAQSAAHCDIHGPGHSNAACKVQHPELARPAVSLAVTTPVASRSFPPPARLPCPVCGKGHSLAACFLGGINRERGPWTLTLAQEQLYQANAVRHAQNQPPLPEVAPPGANPAAANRRPPAPNNSTVMSDRRALVVNMATSDRAGQGQDFCAAAISYADEQYHNAAWNPEIAHPPDRHALVTCYQKDLTAGVGCVARISNTTAVAVQTQMPCSWFSEGPVPTTGGASGSAFKFVADPKQVYDTPERLCVELALHMRHVFAQQLIIAKRFGRVLSTDEASGILAPIFAASQQLQAQVKMAIDKIKSVAPTQLQVENIDLHFVPLALSGKETLKQLLATFGTLPVNLFTILADANRLNLLVLTAHPAARLGHLQQALVVLNFVATFEQPLFRGFTASALSVVAQLQQNMLSNYSTSFPSSVKRPEILSSAKESRRVVTLPSSDDSWGDLLGPVPYDHTLAAQNLRSRSSASIITLLNDSPTSGVAIDFGGTLYLPKTVLDSGCDMCVLLSSALCKTLNLPLVEDRVSIVSESNSGRAELTYRVASPLVLVFAANTEVALTVHVAAYVQSSNNGVYEMLIGQQVMNTIQGNIETSNQLFTYCPRPLDPDTAHLRASLPISSYHSSVVSCVRGNGALTLDPGFDVKCLVSQEGGDDVPELDDADLPPSLSTQFLIPL